MTAVASPGRRARTWAATGSLLGAASVAAAAFLPWWTRHYVDPLSGPLTVSVNGSALWAALLPLALVIAAGYGAATLSMPVIRRAVGIVILAAGLAAAIAAIALLTDAPLALFEAQLRRPAEASGAATISWAGPVTALLGGILSAIGGLAVIKGWPRRARSSAYDSPVDKGRTPATRQAPVADDGSDLWRALDAGSDPTATDPSQS